MIYLKYFEQKSRVLIIVDVQKSFSKFFTENYLTKVFDFCKKFDRVYQIWDNHHMGKVDSDFLYDEEPRIPNTKDLYTFPNQKDLIEKRYNYNVNVDYYRRILDDGIYQKIKKLENSGRIKKGELFRTEEGTAIVYIGNKHKWYHIPKKLMEVFSKYKEITLIGGADHECFEDIETSARSMGLNVNRVDKFIYSASHCFIK